MNNDFNSLPNGITAPPAVKPKSKIELRKAVELRLKGVSLEDIGKLFGVSKQAVHKALQPYVDGDDIDLEVWKEKRADILAGKQASVLSRLTPDDIKNASARDKAVIFGVLYDKERIERGQSTQNIAVIMASAVVEATRLRTEAPEPELEVI